MNHLLKAPLLARRAAGVPVRYVRNRVPEKQKLFQEDNGLPVYLKGGPSDFLMYRATMTLTALGTCYSLYYLYDSSMPKKKA